jgi:uncharacterized protein (DUF302 family)
MSFDEALDEVRFTFAESGFWIVSNVNVTEKVKSKIDPDFPNYTIYWVCNPELGYKYIQEDMDLWVFMPCSVAIYEKDWKVVVSVWLPDIMINPIVPSNKLTKLNKEITGILKKIVDRI